MSEVINSNRIRTSKPSLRLMQISANGEARINWLQLTQATGKALAEVPEFHPHLAIATYFKKPTKLAEPKGGESLYVVSSDGSSGPSFEDKSQVLERRKVTPYMKNWLAYTAMSNFWEDDLNDFLPLMPGKPRDLKSLRNRVIEHAREVNTNIMYDAWEASMSGWGVSPEQKEAEQKAQHMLGVIFELENPGLKSCRLSGEPEWTYD